MSSACQRKTVDPAPLFEVGEDKELDLVCRLLNEAIEESNLKEEYIAACLDVHPSYLSKLKSKEKPWSLKQITRLPPEVEDIFKRKYAETTPGVIVVRQVNEEDALRQLATGLISLLTPKRARMAKAGLP